MTNVSYVSYWLWAIPFTDTRTWWMFPMFLIGFEQMPNDIVWFFYQHIKLSSMKDLDVNKTKPLELQHWFLPSTSYPFIGPAMLNFFLLLKIWKVCMPSASLHPYATTLTQDVINSLWITPFVSSMTPLYLSNSPHVIQNGNLTINNSPV